MIPAALAPHLFAAFDAVTLHHLGPAACTSGPVQAELTTLAAAHGHLFTVQELGRSLEGRPIRKVTFGRGSKVVLLWSQMHGDEPTATLALLDILHYLARHAAADWIVRMLRETTVHAIPLLNPDGAEHKQRWTAAQIDMNRDARRLATPEAALLRRAQQELAPAFGFNLHDQGLSSVGSTPVVTAISLLAPAMDEQKTLSPVRLRAMRIGSLVARILGQFAEGHLATYDDTYEPRAFGDNMQAWGTSTLLIESGQWPGDPEKRFIRKLNFVAILTALHAISTGAYQDVELDYYARLVPNGKRCYDVIIRGVRLEDPHGWTCTADLGLLYEPGAPGLRRPGREAPVIVKEAGDLSGFGALETIEAHGRRISTADLALETPCSLARLIDLLQLYHPAQR